MLSEAMEKALNKQLNAEIFSAYLYLSMVAYFQDQSLPGFAHWMTIQNEEENFHAMKFFRYIAERGGRVCLEAIEKPQFTWDSPLQVMEAALEHERLISKNVNELANLALDERDHATGSFLRWFIDEQVEEEDNVSDVVQKLRLLGGNGGGLFMMDRDLGTRVFTPPA